MAVHEGWFDWRVFAPFEMCDAAIVIAVAALLAPRRRLVDRLVHAITLAGLRCLPHPRSLVANLQPVDARARRSVAPAEHCHLTRDHSGYTIPLDSRPCQPVVQLAS